MKQRKEESLLWDYGWFIIEVIIIFIIVTTVILWYNPAKQDCNNNPREDDLCKCEETKNTDAIVSMFACPNSCKQITIQKCKVYGMYHYSQELEIVGDILYDDYCEFNSYFGDITEGKNISMQIIEENITNCEQCYEYKQECIKSRPKTECEKGNPDWVEENITTYKGKRVSCKDLGFKPIQCSPEDFCVEICTIGNTTEKTICREKTEVEKLMNKDCNWLFIKLITVKNNYDKNKFAKAVTNCESVNQFPTKWGIYKRCLEFQNYKQAFQQKGCEV